MRSSKIVFNDFGIIITHKCRGYFLSHPARIVVLAHCSIIDNEQQTISEIHRNGSESLDKRRKELLVR